MVPYWEIYTNGTKEVHTQQNFYDAENLRYGIEEDGERTNFVTNGWSVFTELDAEWKPTKRLVRGYGIVASEEIGTATITDVESGYSNGYHYYHQNEHGDIEYITGKDGKIENAYTYDAFGNITSSTELVKNRYTYNGELYDNTTSQYYLRARYYNPLIARFTQEDVYRGDGLNLYAYCGSNPVMYVDPSGYAKKCGTGSEGGSDTNPTFEVSRKQYPNHVKMLENAQQKGHSLTNLTRGSGTRAARKNRYEAQKTIRKQQGGPPKGYDYDEFPYASTKQGGAGSHVEPVSSTENQAVGRDLGLFYRKYNIKEDDLFNVEIID